MVRWLICTLLGAALLAATASQSEAGLANVWNFGGDLSTTYGPGGMYYMDEDDAAHDPPGIPVGNSAYRTGTPPVGHASTRSLTTFGTTLIGGQPAGYMTFPKATDTWTGYYVDHTYGPTDTVWNRVNQYTMIFDIRVPASAFSSDDYLSLFQTSGDNSNNGDLFIGLKAPGYPARVGAVGISTTGVGYSPAGVIQPNTWHRVAWVYDEKKTASPNTRVASIYVDGVLVHQSDASFTDAGQFRPYHQNLTAGTPIIDPMRGFFLFTSNLAGENSSAQLASFLFVDRPMTQLEVQGLGGVTANGLMDAVSHAPGVATLQALSPTHYYRLNETVADTSSPTVMDIGGAPMTAQHAGNFGSGPLLAQAGANGVWLPGFEKGNKGMFHNDGGAVNLGPSSSFAAETMTVSVWFKVKQPTYGVGGQYADRIFLNNDATHQLGVYAWTNETTGADIGLALSNGTDQDHSALLPSSVVNLHDGRWHHAVIVRHGGGTVSDGANQRANVSLIVDGVDYSSYLVRSASSWGNTPSNAYIGTRAVGTSGNFAGTTDEVAVWLNKQLSVAEAVELYNAARTPASLPHYASTVMDMKPIAFYRFEEPAGITAGETVVNWANQGTTSVNVLGDANSGFSELYPETAPTFNVTGPRPTDLLNGRRLQGLAADNTAAQFFGYQTGVPNSGDLVSIGDKPALLDGPEITYSLLFNITAANDYMRIIATDSEAANTFHLLMHQGKLVLVSNSGTGSTEGSYNDGVWHHLVAVRSGDASSDLRLFVDGDLVPLTPGTGSYTKPSTTRIGALDGGVPGGTFIGLLDEVALWNRALSAVEARALFDAAVVPEPASIVLLGLGMLGLLAGRLRRRSAS